MDCVNYCCHRKRKFYKKSCYRKLCDNLISAMSTGLLFGSKEQEARVKLPRNHHTEQHTHTHRPWPWYRQSPPLTDWHRQPTPDWCDSEPGAANRGGRVGKQNPGRCCVWPCRLGSTLSNSGLSTAQHRGVPGVQAGTLTTKYSDIAHDTRNNLKAPAPARRGTDQILTRGRWRHSCSMAGDGPISGGRWRHSCVTAGGGPISSGRWRHTVRRNTG